MNKENQKSKSDNLKPSLAWTLADFLNTNEEPPACVMQGRTEGQITEDDDAYEWVAESMRCLRVMHEEFPQKYPEQKQIFDLDLEYLASLDKITAEEKDELLKPENFVFEEPK